MPNKTAVSRAGEDRSREDPRKEQSQQRQPRERIPLGGLRQKLVIHDKDPGYEYRWIKAQGGARIDDALRGGWVPVMVNGTENGGTDEWNDDSDPNNKDGWMTRSSGRTETGSPELLYAFKIRKEWFEEDQALKRERRDAQESAIRGGTHPSQTGDVPGSLVYENAQIETNLRR